jgi:hypothetical protein
MKGNVTAWDISEGVFSQHSLHFREAFLILFLSGDGFIQGSDRPVFSLLDSPCSFSHKGVRSLDCPSPNKVLVGMFGGTLLLWIPTEKTVRVLGSLSGTITSIKSFEDDSREMVAIGDTKGNLSIMDLKKENDSLFTFEVCRRILISSSINPLHSALGSSPTA